MKNKIYGAIAILTVIVALTTATVQAQSASKVKVSVPFQFSAGSATLKSGVYSIRRVSADILMLRSEDGKSKVLLSAPVTRTSNDPKAIEKVVFIRDGDRYSLSEIWLTSDSGRRVMGERNKSNHERIEIALKAK